MYLWGYVGEWTHVGEVFINWCAEREGGPSQLSGEMQELPGGRKEKEEKEDKEEVEKE